MSLARVGSIAVEHGNPSFGFDSDGTGVRSASISGLATWDQAKQLNELVNNQDRKIHAGGRSGVLEVVWFSDAYLDDFNGWYLLEAASLAAGQEHSLSDFTAPFSLKAAYLGTRQPVVVHSWRQLANDFGIAGQGAWAYPFWEEQSPGHVISITSDLVIIAREYEAA